MKRSLLTAFFILALSLVTSAAPRRVVLVVQNHCVGAEKPPLSALADTLVTQLASKGFAVVNPHNAIGVTQNVTANGEAMPEMSANELARSLNAEGIITASILEFTSEGIPPVAKKLKTRLAMSLADAATGETIFGYEDIKPFSKTYLNEQVSADNATLYAEVMHLAAAKCAAIFLAKAANAVAEWTPGTADNIVVFFGCNVLGADIQIDGLSYGTCPAQLSVTPGVHNLLISYPPYYLDFKRRVMFNTDGQTYAVVLQITPEGEKVRRSGELFEKQKALIDAELARYQLSGETEDYVRKTIADGTSMYWKNSYGRIVITNGRTRNIEFTTPVTDAGELQNAPTSNQIGDLLRAQLRSAE